MASEPLSAEDIEQALEQSLEVEFTFIKVDDLVSSIAALSPESQDFVLDWVRRIATTNVQIAHQFARRALPQLDKLDRRVIEAWALQAMDAYDRAGLRPALEILNEIEGFVHRRHEHAAGVLFTEVCGILLTFVRGLSGRRLKLEQGDTAYTDSETLYL